MDFKAKHRIVRQAWESEKDPSGEFNDAWVSFFVNYFPVEWWILESRDELSELECRQVELTYQGLLAAMGVEPDGEYVTWSDVLGADETHDPVLNFDDPSETDPNMWVWPQ